MRKFITIGDVEMKKIVLCILIGFYFATNVFCDGQDENLKRANQYYDADDYIRDYDEFIKLKKNGLLNLLNHWKEPKTSILLNILTITSIFLMERLLMRHS